MSELLKLYLSAIHVFLYCVTVFLNPSNKIKLSDVCLDRQPDNLVGSAFSDEILWISTLFHFDINLVLAGRILRNRPPISF